MSSRTKLQTKLQRTVVMSALALVGALSAFAVGAKASEAINGQASHVTVARIPMPELQAAVANAK